MKTYTFETCLFIQFLSKQSFTFEQVMDGNKLVKDVQ